MSRFAVPLTAAAAIILSAPFIQQAFTAADGALGPYFRPAGIAATVLPIGIALAMAAVSIRDRRLERYGALVASLAIGASYVVIDALSFAESFHFVEYGLLAWLFHRAWRTHGGAAAILLPLFSGVMVGTLDEWFQWFIPIRAGEARDIVLNGVASGCGVLCAIATDPWPGFLGRPGRQSAIPLLVGGGALGLFVLFFLAVHVGHDVREAEIGGFRSRYTSEELSRLARDRAVRWRTEPPLVQRRLSREDQYLTEGLWHVQQRNQALSAGNAAEAWRENRILEQFFSPLLGVPTYADPRGHAWSAEQRREVEVQVIAPAPMMSDAYPYPLYVWPAGP